MSVCPSVCASILPHPLLPTLLAALLCCCYPAHYAMLPQGWHAHYVQSAMCETWLHMQGGRELGVPHASLLDLCTTIQMSLMSRHRHSARLARRGCTVQTGPRARMCVRTYACVYGRSYGRMYVRMCASVRLCVRSCVCLRPCGGTYDDQLHTYDRQRRTNPQPCRSQLLSAPLTVPVYAYSPMYD
jgi:hypothetical protein